MNQVRIVIMIEGKLGKDLQPNQITIVFFSQLFQKTKWMIFFSLLTLFSNSTNIRFDLIEFKTPQVCTITAQFIIKTNTFRESTIFMQGMFPPLRRCRPEQLWYFCLWEKTFFSEESHQYNALLKAFHGGQEWKPLPYDVIHIGRAHLIIWIHYTSVKGAEKRNPVCFFPQILIVRKLPMFAQKSPLANPSTIRSRVCSSSNWSIAAWIEIFILDFPVKFFTWIPILQSSQVMLVSSGAAHVGAHIHSAFSKLGFLF